MTDRIFTNAVDRDGNPLELAVANGRFSAIGSSLPRNEGIELVDLGGRLVVPGFVDGHIHLDKSFVGDRWHPHQPASTLRERLAHEKRELAASAPIADRANALVAQAVSFGTVAMRCHVDVDATTGFTNLHAVAGVRERWRGIVDIELVAFPQAGVVSCAGTTELLDAAMGEGAQVVGGIDPETLDGDSEGQLDIVFGIAERHGVKIDIHLHEPVHGGIAQLRRIAERTRALGLSGRVAVSHAYSLGEVPETDVDRIAAELAGAGVAIMTNAPGDRPFPPVQRLRKAGVEIFMGNDNIQDAWWPYGNGDMLQRAMLLGYRSGFYTDADLGVAFDMISHAGARVIGLQGYGLEIGNDATFLVLDAPNAAAAVAAVPYARRIVRRGEFADTTHG